MKETQEDIERLQALLDNSIERAGTFLRRSFQMPEHSLSARQLIDCWQNVQTAALATVTTKGEPRIAPISALLYRGEIYIPTVATAARTRHIMKRPAVSLTLLRENELAIIVHGHAAIVSPDYEAGCKRLWLITTNDNLHALRFYQKRGFALVAVHRNAVDAARQLKPSIPLIGDDQIAIHDEIELEKML